MPRPLISVAVLPATISSVITAPTPGPSRKPWPLKPKAWNRPGCVSLGPTTPLLIFGPHLVGLAAGDLVPGQIGALDGAFAFASSALGITRAAALSIPVVLHVVQLAWGAIGVVAWRR